MKRFVEGESWNQITLMPTYLDDYIDGYNLVRVIDFTVEHVFGTLKFWMGSAHFLMKTIKHAGTEMSLHVLAYNLRRVINILGIAGLMKMIRILAV